MIDEKELEKLRNWRNQPPKTHQHLAALDPIEILGKLKADGHIGRILLIHGIPRSTSTVAMKALASSPSINPTLPMFHEVFSDNQNRVKGATDILIGKLLEKGVLQAQNLDLIAKVMSHEFTGKSFENLLPHVDAVISTIREPERHIDCLANAMAKEMAHEEVVGFFGMVSGATKKAWESFDTNIKAIEKYNNSAVVKPIFNEVIDGDRLAQIPHIILPFMCQELSKSGFKIQFNQTMMSKWRTDVFDPSNDPWAKEEKSSEGFNNKKYVTRKVRPEYEEVYQYCSQIYDTLKYKYPLAEAFMLDGLEGTRKRVQDQDKTPT